MGRGPQSSLIQPGEDGPRPTRQIMRSSAGIKPELLVNRWCGHKARLTPPWTSAQSVKGEGDRSSQKE